MINLEMNSIEEDILDCIVDLYIEREEDNSKNNIWFAKEDIVEETKYNNVQVRNALTRLSYKGFIFNYRYKQWKLYRDKLQLVKTEKTKRQLQNGIF